MAAEEKHVLDVPALLQWLNGMAAEINVSAETVAQAFNALLTSYARDDPAMVSGGRNTFYQWPANGTVDPRSDLKGGLIVLKGFFLSVRMATSRLIVNVQLKHTPFVKEMPLLDLMLLHIRRNEDCDDKLRRLSAFLKGLSIVTWHMTDRATGRAIPSRKTIFGLATLDDQGGASVGFLGGGPPDVAFEEKNGSDQDEVSNTNAVTITVAEYFKKSKHETSPWNPSKF